MIKWQVSGTALALVLFAAGAARADILYFSDGSIGTDSMGTALNQWISSHPGTSVFSTSSDTTFATQLATGKYSIAVFFTQIDAPMYYPTGFSALQSFVAGGGRAIIDNFATFAGSGAVLPFGAQFSGPTNQTQFTVTNPALNPGVYTLTNPGYGIFSAALTPTTGVGAAYFTPGDPTTAAIVIGNGGRTIFDGFLSDTLADPSQGVALYTAELNSLQSGTVPEPGSLTLLGIGAAGLGAGIWRRRKSRNSVGQDSNPDRIMSGSES